MFEWQNGMERSEIWINLKDQEGNAGGIGMSDDVILEDENFVEGAILMIWINDDERPIHGKLLRQNNHYMKIQHKNDKILNIRKKSIWMIRETAASKKLRGAYQ